MVLESSTTSLLTIVESNYMNFIAFALFISLWMFTVHFDNIRSKDRPSVRNLMNIHRFRWINMLVYREDRHGDIATIKILQESINFLATTSMLIIAGLITLYLNLEQSKTLLLNLTKIHVIDEISSETYHLKLLLPIATFILAFTKQIWAIRMLNISAVLIGSLPHLKKKYSHSAQHSFNHDYDKDILRAAKLCSLATLQMTRGIKTSYFGLISITWLFGPNIFIALSITTAFILYWLEYYSPVTKILRLENAKPKRIIPFNKIEAVK